ncbi:BTAD domain-containing putative transcriptional regulator [Paractinoplanes bogorensis]|uniref:BTAD domain-containing putative transcriptional regulator n=1 Tax=Paractinoplanes bogorensis TaxID=1610840 RepID=UPI001FEAA503|nr:BTAD domain-containing putative transcriptional regulator [Actinoplanes bogorensis]
MRVWRDEIEQDPGPRQQAYLLALLLVSAGSPLSTTELISLIWGDDPPVSAVNILQKYVGALRRLLEPELSPREPGSFVQRRGAGYIFRAPPPVLDVVAFREEVRAARSELAQDRPAAALDRYLAAVTLWHGPAGYGLTAGPAADSIFTAVNEEFTTACVRAAGLALSLGRPDQMLPPLQLATWMAPLDERVQAALITALGAAGRQAEALTVYQRVRARLADELGVDPGPALQAAHQSVLRAKEATHEPTRVVGEAAVIGCDQEIAVLRDAARSALDGETGLVLVQGEPGIGKTHLLEQVAAGAERRGTHVVWGRCLSGHGAPSMWVWVQVVNALLEHLPGPEREKWRADELGRLIEPGAADTLGPADSGGRFRLFELVVDLVATVAGQRPLLLLIDDLQGADIASLEMFTHLVARLPDRTAVAGAFRDRAPEPGPELSRMLAVASRMPRHRRVRLGPLDPDQVAELVRRETGQRPEAGAARGIHARTAGNPFFVRELARLLADGTVLSETAVARAGVPSTVRDVVRDRMSGLDVTSTGLAQLAALIAHDIDLGLLARAAGVDAATCLDRLEPLLTLGLVELTPGNPRSVRFAHDLVRESVAGTITHRRSSRLHLDIADAIEPAGGDERLAHHLWSAGPLADPARAVDALVRAGRLAAAKSAFEAAEDQFRAALQVARAAGLAEREFAALSQLTAIAGMRTGFAGSAFELLKRAETLARDLGRERDVADLLFSQLVGSSHFLELDRSAGLARRLLELGEVSDDPIVRTYGLQAWGMQLWNTGDVTGAAEYLNRCDETMLVDLARRADDPLSYDRRLLWPTTLALVNTVHGRYDEARALIETLKGTTGEEPYAVALWTSFASMVAAAAGDPGYALRAVDWGTTRQGGHRFEHVDRYTGLAACWARSVTGDGRTGIGQAREIIATMLDPPQTGISFYLGLLGEMQLADGQLEAAAATLDQAGRLLDSHGQRYPEGLLLVLRARLMLARGEPVAVVRAAAEHARALSAERGAHLFAVRAQELLTAIG